MKPIDVHRLATELAGDNATPTVAEFYRVVLADPSAAEFLTTEQVERQLQEALRRWLIDVLSCRVEQVEEQMRRSSALRMFMPVLVFRLI